MSIFSASFFFHFLMLLEEIDLLGNVVHPAIPNDPVFYVKRNKHKY